MRKAFQDQSDLKGFYLLGVVLIFLAFLNEIVLTDLRFLVFYFPVDQGCQGSAQQDDPADDDKLAGLADNDGPQNLTAKLELKRHGHPLGEIQTGGGSAADIAPDALDAGPYQHANANVLEEQDRVLDNGI